MPEWHAISNDFSSALLDPERPVPAGLKGPSPFKLDKRFSVYRNNITLSLIGALEANFPAVRRLVGEEFFSAMAKVFVRAHPPGSRLLCEYSSDFPAFLAGFEPLARYPYMADVARIERLWLDAYHEADAEPLNGAVLGALDPETLFAARFIPHPATRLFRSSFAAVSIMSANRTGADTSVIDPSIPEFGMLTRPRLAVDIRHISSSTFDFLDALIGASPLGEAVERALAGDPDFDVSTNLRGVLAAGAFTAIK